MDFNLFNEEYNQKVRNEWEKFINGKPVTPGIIRPEVFEIWEECQQKGIDPHKEIVYDLLPAEEFAAILSENKLMCNIASPFMEELYENVPGPTSFVVLFNKDCIPLIQISNDDNANAEHLNVMKNASTSSKPDSFYGMITDTIICQRTKKPYFCYGEEHYADNSKDALCSSAPILDDNGNLQGILTISVNLNHAHWHTMGMMLSATRAIEDEMRLHIANEHTLNIASQLAATIESVPQGMFVLDNEGYIKHINSYAKTILFMDSENILDKHISDILIDNNNMFKKPLSFLPEQEIILKTSKGNTRYFITIKNFSPEDNPERDFTLIILKEHDYAKTLSNNVTNSYSRFSFSNIIGNSKALAHTINMAQIAAKSTSTVLITGPSGTGKELFAHSIHSASGRCNGPFISVNCGALPSGLVESELFGYERGAFTGAKKEGQIGKFELANHGTIFLDEIGEMPLSVQASVLRVLETKEVTRIGGSNTNLLDVRILAATNRDLQEAIKCKEFREDLYYRLNVLRISIPPLCERKEDIELLADHFIKIHTEKLNKQNISISTNAYEMLKQYNYPGNVRELENIIERVVNICESDSIITPDILKFFMTLDNIDFSSDYDDTDETATSSASTSSSGKSGQLLRDVEKNLIIDTLKANNGSVTKTAEATGIGRRTLYRKFDEYGIDYTEYRKK